MPNPTTTTSISMRLRWEWGQDNQCPLCRLLTEHGAPDIPHPEDDDL